MTKPPAPPKESGRLCVSLEPLCRRCFGRMGTMDNEAGFDRIRDFVVEAADSGREPRPDWRAVLRDVALDLDKIAYSAVAHPDSVAAARLAMSALAGVWLDAEETELLYLGTAD